MDVILYYVLCFIARKKIVVNVSYFLGTVVFVSLSYSTANNLYKIPVIIQSSLTVSLTNINQSSNGSSVNIAARCENRTKFLRNQCGGNSEPSVQSLSSIVPRSEMLNHLGFVLRSHSLFYCSVPKVATRTLLNFITYLHVRDELIKITTHNSTSGLFKLSSDLNSNSFKADYLKQMLSTSIANDSTSLLSSFQSRLMSPNQSNSSQVDLWLMYQNKALPYIRLRTLSDLSILSSASFTRIIFVRHPLERLASAYVDKIASIKGDPFSLYNNLRRTICRHFFSSYLTIAEQEVYYVRKQLIMHVNEPCATIIAKFEHFVEYIMSDSSQLDVHWQPYSSLCHACTLKYNFIGKYETMQEDLQLLMSHLSLNTTDWNFNNNFSTGRTKHDYRSMYSQLPTRLICSLKHFYSDDFRLFDYRLEDYLIGHRQIHCPFQRNQQFRRLS